MDSTSASDTTPSIDCEEVSERTVSGMGDSEGAQTTETSIFGQTCDYGQTAHPQEQEQGQGGGGFSQNEILYAEVQLLQEELQWQRNRRHEQAVHIHRLTEEVNRLNEANEELEREVAAKEKIIDRYRQGTDKIESLAIQAIQSSRQE